MKNSSEPLYGNNRFEGYCIELIDMLSKNLGFNYEFKLIKGPYGEEDEETKLWSGMLGEINKGNGHLAVTDLTMTAKREAAFDFTSPFMILGISIIYEQPKKEEPDYTSFLKPFSRGVWLMLIACFFLVAISLFLLGRIAPEEWFNPYTCIENPDTMHNLLTFKNCLWFTIGIMFMEGTEIAPR